LRAAKKNHHNTRSFNLHLSTQISVYDMRFSIISMIILIFRLVFSGFCGKYTMAGEM